MCFFNKHNKIFGALGLILMLTPSLFLAAPQKASAIVPVSDAALAKISGGILTQAGKQTTLQGTLVKKELTWDLLLWAFVKALIHQLVQSVVQWIRTGFSGNPLFVTDMKRFLLNATDEAAGIFFDKMFR